MLHVLGCITGQHDLRLVVLAGILCLFACLAAMSMIARGRAVGGRWRRFWLVAAGAVAGSGIWGTHFVAMLAYRAGFPVAYDIGLTILSIAVAVTLCGVGFLLCFTRAGAVIGGAVTGAAIGAMHYIGMAAVRAPADAVWDTRYVAASAIIGVALTSFGMWIALKRDTVASYAWGGVILTVAICSMHFTGMSAVVFRPDPAAMVPNVVLAPDVLAVAVAAIAILIVALGLAGAMLDHHLAERATGEADRLRAKNAALEATKRELEATSANLSHALALADAANRSKSQFLAAMSHELRTPLNAVIGFSDVMAKELFGPLGHGRYREYASDICASGAHLLSLINDILDLSRLDADQLVLSEEELDPGEVIAEAMRMLCQQAEKSGIALEQKTASALPRLNADHRRFRQVLINLLSNAIKFTPSGGRVAVAADLNEAGELTIRVVDTGIGIAPQDIAKALEPFGQVDGQLSRKYEGAGLGLPLSRQLMGLHGGRLTLESEVAAGTIVTIVFPQSRVARWQAVA
ncbi:MAG TPA: MHYT domain-containing protein [Rhizomicrobium sp.]